MPHYFEITVENPTLIKTTAGYEQIKVYRSATPDGTYTYIGTPVILSTSQYLYTCMDGAGDPGYWYKYTFYDADSSSESSAYGPYQGGSPLYCKVNDLKDSMGETGTDYDRLLIQKVQAATAEIKQYCGRHFEQVSETRYFSSHPYTPGAGLGSLGYNGYGWPGLQGCQELDLLFDDLVSVSSLVCDFSNGRGELLETWTEGTDFRLTRLGGSAMRQRPFNRVDVLRDITTKSGYFPTGYRAVKITGVWGWPADPVTGSPIPAEVRDACLYIATRMYKGKDNGYSRTVGNSEVNGSFMLTDRFINADVKDMLSKYCRIRAYGSGAEDWSSERV
jgi:hypothetical protein